MVYDEVNGGDSYDNNPTLYTLHPAKPSYKLISTTEIVESETGVIRNNGPPTDLIISIKYTNNSVLYLSPEEWSQVRADGVDEIIISNPLPIHCSGHSIYWFYKEDNYYVLGCASNYLREPIAEVLFKGTEQISRSIKYMPDLYHKDIKLGWWRPNEERIDIDG